MNNWICTAEFAGAEPKDHYFREMDTSNDRVPEVKNVHVLFRKKFTLESIRVTTVSITADDYYMLYINGKFVTQGPAAAYHFCQNVNTVDITPYLRTGDNVIAVHCFYSGYINRVYNSGDMRMGLYAEVAENGRILLTTDETWKYSEDLSYLPSDITWGYATQTPENRDMRLYPYGWNEVEFDDSEWKNAHMKTDDDHECVEQITPNVDSNIIYPSDVIRFGDGRFILDFGKETVGQAIVDVCGKRGSKIRMYFAEELDKDGHALHNMRCNCDYDETIILSGEHDKIVNFEYKGFRYIEIITEDKNVKPESISVLKRNYPVRNKAVLKSSESLIEDIWKICENAVIISSQEAFLDCPTREKGQYLGDMTVTALSHSYITGDTRLYKKALIDFANTRFITKGLMAVAPGGYMQEIADFSLLYPLQLLNYFNLTGDMSLTNMLLSVAEDAVEHFRQFERPDGLIENVTDKWNLVDWPDNLRDNYDFELTKPVGKGCHNVINAYYYGAMKSVNEIRTALGFGPKYDTENLLNSYKKAFFREGKNLFADSEISNHCNYHSNVLPLYFEMFEADKIENAVKYIMDKGFCCGVFFSYFVLKGLAKYEKYDEIYRLITNESIHSWKNMLEEGATSVFEAWGKEQKWNTSLCHPWGSTPVISIVEDLLGYRYIAGKLQKLPEHLPEGVEISIKGGLIG